MPADDYILDNFYDYSPTNADKVDFFIVATEAQKAILLQFHYWTRPKIVTIPVGESRPVDLSQEPRKPFSMFTASRLATEMIG